MGGNSSSAKLACHHIRGQMPCGLKPKDLCEYLKTKKEQKKDFAHKLFEVGYYSTLETNNRTDNLPTLPELITVGFAYELQKKEERFEKAESGMMPKMKKDSHKDFIVQICGLATGADGQLPQKPLSLNISYKSRARLTLGISEDGKRGIIDYIKQTPEFGESPDGIEHKDESFHFEFNLEKNDMDKALMKIANEEYSCVFGGQQRATNADMWRGFVKTFAKYKGHAVRDLKKKKVHKKGDHDKAEIQRRFAERQRRMQANAAPQSEEKDNHDGNI